MRQTLAKPRKKSKDRKTSIKQRTVIKRKIRIIPDELDPIGESFFEDDELATLEEFEKLEPLVFQRFDKAEAPLPQSKITQGEQIQRRNKVTRRRRIDPTTSERDYSREEVEFMNALDDYKRASGRMFPTCSEILEVLRHLGYEKR